MRCFSPIATSLLVGAMFAVGDSTLARASSGSGKSTDAQRLSVRPPAPKAANVASKPPWHPFGASLSLSHSLGTGTFVEGPAHRPYLNMALAFRPQVLVFEDLSMFVRGYIGFNVNLVENADTTTTTAHQPRLDDVSIGVTLVPLKVVFGGTSASDVTPSIELRTTFDLFAPTSLASQMATRLLGLQLGVACVARPVKGVEVGYGLKVTKNFNRFNNTVIDARTFAQPPVARAGDPAAVDDFLIATGAGVTEWGVGNSFNLSWRFVERWTLSLGFDLLVAIAYQRDIPIDAFSSPYAQPNRGTSEIMRGSFGISFEVSPNLSLTLGTFTEQEPLQADNVGIRSPWWDSDNGAANRQVIYLDIVGSI